jgi:hypothetical protein
MDILLKYYISDPCHGGSMNLYQPIPPIKTIPKTPQPIPPIISNEIPIKAYRKAYRKLGRKSYRI